MRLHTIPVERVGLLIHGQHRSGCRAGAQLADTERSAVTAPASRRLLHPEFVEIGASGRRWSRAEMLDALLQETTVAAVEAFDLVARQLAPDVVLVTFTTRRGTTLVHRSSIWVRLGGDWTVLFHQGTVADPAE